MSDYTEILPEEEIKTDIPFWYQDPNILFNSFILFPTENLSFNENLNSITRLIIIITIITFIITSNIRLIFILFICLFSIYLLYYYSQIKENFHNPTNDLIKGNVTNVFDDVTPDNIFSNVLVTDYSFNPDKKPAPPDDDTIILKNAKQMVTNMHPEDKNISNKLFSNLQDQYVFEQSLQPFNSNPSTTIPNDQTGFAEFCYGSMISAKEGNLFSLARNLSSYKV